MKKILLIPILIILILAPLGAFGSKESQDVNKKLTVVVSILPHQFVVDQIGGHLVESLVLVGSGQSPHSYEPTPNQMALLSDSDVWILSNTDFELSLVPKIKSLYPKLLVVDGTEGVTFRYLEEHSHGDEEHFHSDMELDRHSWMGKEPMQILAKKVASTLIDLDHPNESYYQDNLDNYLNKIDVLFEKLEVELEGLRGTSVLVYHPSFGYLLDEFEIEQKAIEMGGKEPTAKALSSLIEMASKEHVKALFVQAQFPTSAAKNVAEAIGAAVIPIDPLAYNWFENIEQISSLLKESL